MINLRVKFTRWYYHKGYQMIYRAGEMIFDCPFWVRPLASFFFSPSVYYREFGYDLVKGFNEGWSNAECGVNDSNDSRLEDTEEIV